MFSLTFCSVPLFIGLGRWLASPRRLKCRAPSSPAPAITLACEARPKKLARGTFGGRTARCNLAHCEKKKAKFWKYWPLQAVAFFFAALCGLAFRPDPSMWKLTFTPKGHEKFVQCGWLRAQPSAGRACMCRCSSARS